jgi:hypothetical protein
MNIVFTQNTSLGGLNFNPTNQRGHTTDGPNDGQTGTTTDGRNDGRRLMDGPIPVYWIWVLSIDYKEEGRYQQRIQTMCMLNRVYTLNE